MLKTDALGRWTGHGNTLCEGRILIILSSRLLSSLTIRRLMVC